jgi:tRNA-specific 2-thiouridylase
VLDISPVDNTVRVGPVEALDVDEVLGDRPVWTDGTPRQGLLDCVVQLRAHGEPVPATALLDGDTLRVELATPARGIAAGQAVVLYHGDAVIGSATISSARNRAAATA